MKLKNTEAMEPMEYTLIEMGHDVLLIEVTERWAPQEPRIKQALESIRKYGALDDSITHVYLRDEEGLYYRVHPDSGALLSLGMSVTPSYIIETQHT